MLADNNRLEIVVEQLPQGGLRITINGETYESQPGQTLQLGGPSAGFLFFERPDARWQSDYDDAVSQFANASYPAHKADCDGNCMAGRRGYMCTSTAAQVAIDVANAADTSVQRIVQWMIQNGIRKLGYSIAELVVKYRTGASARQSSVDETTTAHEQVINDDLRRLLEGIDIDL